MAYLRGDVVMFHELKDGLREIPHELSIFYLHSRISRGFKGDHVTGLH